MAVNARLIPLINKNEWQLKVPDLSWNDGLYEALHFIPGLRVDRLGEAAYGTADAVEVACRRLKLQSRPLKLHTSIEVNDARLRPYQRDGVAWLVDRMQNEGAALLADDMGLGKTLQAIRAVQQLRDIQRILVIAPASVRETWKNELKKWAPADTVGSVETGEQAASEAVLLFRWLITSYELAQKLNIQYLPHLVLIDEAHLVKGTHARRSKRVEELASIASYRLAMTGTPMWDRPRDFWMLLRILFQGRFGSKWDFDHAYCGGVINEWGGMDNKGATRTEELKARLSWVMLRREKAEVAKDLPELTRQVVWLPGTLAASAALKGALINRKRGMVAEAVKATLKAKLPVAIAKCIEAKRFLCLTWMKEDARAIQKGVEDAGGKAYLITGDLSTPQRQAVIARAKEEGGGIVATIDSVSTGVDGIQYVADVGIMHVIDYVPNKLAQAEARLHRIGQKNAVQWVYLAMQESMDSVIVKTVVDKLDQWRALMGAKSNIGIRNALGDRIDGAGAEEAEQEALRALYEAMGDE